MKVIHILHSLKFSGAEIMYVGAAPLFQEKGCELTVVATADELGEYAPYFEKAGYVVKHFPYPPVSKLWKRLLFAVRFIRMLKAEKYDVVHNHRSGTYWIMALCARVAGIRSVYTFHSVFPTHFYSYPYHLWLRWSAKYLFSCKFQTISDSVFTNELELYHNRTTKIYNWYNNLVFSPAKENEKREVRMKLNIPQDAFVIVSVGGCSPVKRHTEIIKAIPEIRKQIPTLFYLHLGTGESEAEEIRLANELQVNPYIGFYGNQTDVRSYLIASDIYLMTSRYEGIPISTIEALGCGIPAILYNVPGLRDFNREIETSIIIAEDYLVLAESVISLYRDSEKRSQLSENGFKYVNEKYNMSKNVGEIYTLYLEK
jgi:glycosyltransferase involved in cell wall biosynthesis